METLLAFLRKKLLPGGTAGADTLVGTEQNDVMAGFGGNDDLDGLDGNDWIFGGSGRDQVVGGNGDDFLHGGSGNDAIFGDSVSPGGGFGNDLICGGDGNDLVQGGMGSNEIHGGAGHDTLYATWAGIGNAGLGGPATIYGGSGNDTIFGEQADDKLWGGSGNDIIVGFEGNDLIEGGGGNDDLTWGLAFAPTGIGTLRGGSGNDILRGSLVHGNMEGGSGNDLLVLGRFDATPPGGGLVTVDGGAGFDTLSIVNRDTFDLTGADGDALRRIEKIDMSSGVPQGAATTLSLDLESIVSLLGAANTLFVNGDADDSVIATGAFASNGTVTRGGVLFDRWTLNGTHLAVGQDVAVTFV